MFHNTYMSISTKLSLTVSLLIIILLTVFSSILIYREGGILEENLQSKGETITKNVAMTCATALMGNDYSFLNRVVKQLTKDQDIVYAMILNKEDSIIVANPLSTKKDADILALQKKIKQKGILQRYYSKEFKSELYDITMPIVVSGESWGNVRLGISLKDMKHRIRSNIIIIILMSLATVLIGILAVFQLGRRISKPIQKLVQSASIIAQGILDNPVDVVTNDEVGILAHTFERMRVSLKSQISDIARKAMGLEGDLKVFSLPDLIQMVCSNQQTGILHLQKGKDWGKFYISQGDILRLESSWNDKHTNAFFRFFNWSEGEFHFDRVPVDVERNVSMAWEHIIMEGARHTDELDRIKKLIPSDETRFAVVDNPPENVKKIKLTIDELQLSSLIQEEKTVRSILALSPFDEFRTYKLLYSLTSAGLLRVLETVPK